jgi:aminoglycoside phosphotransferase (APT) family kinase protein
MARRRAELGLGSQVLVHGDFHAGNIHWLRGRVAGVIDWEMARWGPAAADVAYAYMDFVLAAGRPAANAFLERYTALAGVGPGFDAWLLVAATRPLPDPAAWLPSYKLAGYAELTPALLRRRLGRLVRTIA